MEEGEEERREENITAEDETAGWAGFEEKMPISSGCPRESGAEESCCCWFPSAAQGNREKKNVEKPLRK